MSFSEITIESAPGVRLALRHYTAEAADATVIMNSAMGVPQRFYEEFAEFLVARGCNVITYDYHGIGGSRDGPLADMPDELADWGRRDQEAVIRYARQNAPATKTFLLGHSVGGQLMGLAPSAAEVDGLLLVASQSGFWGHWQGLMRIQVFLLWHLLIPLLTRLLGYFPSHWFGIGKPLPPRVARQWARWARDPDYLHGKYAPAGAERYADIHAPLLAIWIADDDFATRASCEALVSRYASSRSEFLAIHPNDIGLQRLGHFGVFREEVGEPVWQQIIEWIRKR